MKLWAFHDIRNWGSTLAQKAQERGHDAHLFEEPRDPDSGVVFMHMHYHPSVRLFHKRGMAIMAVNTDLTLIPDYRSSNLFDDKLEQARQLAKWMPRTQVFYTPGAANRYLNCNTAFPFMSKASEGANAHNVRLVKNHDEAKLEIRQSFSDLGIKLRAGQAQRGYLLWQDFIPDNQGDIRIVTIGTKRLIQRRAPRPDQSMGEGAGSRRLIPVTRMDAELMDALAFVNKVVAAEHFRWCAVDVVKDAAGRWFVIGVTVSWSFPAFYECAFFNEVGEPIGRLGNDAFSVLLDEMEQGAFA